MQHVQFGDSGQRIWRMCLGTVMFGRRCGEAEAGRIVAASLERGLAAHVVRAARALTPVQATTRRTPASGRG